MKTRVLQRMAGLLLLVSLLLAPLGAAQDDNPTIGILSTGFDYSRTATGALLDVLQGYEFISAEERPALDNREDIRGENLNIFWGNADRDAADISVVAQAAIDKAPDVLVVHATTLAQTAANLTNDMTDPPIVLFTSVSDPYGAGLAQARCLKQPHITGVQWVQDYNVVFDALLMQQPELETVGVIFGIGAASERVAADAVATAAERGINATEASVVGLSDLAIATDGLVSKGVDAIIMPASNMLLPGSGIVVEAAQDAGIPVVTPMLMSIYEGVTMGIGHYRYLEEGYTLGRILAGWLNGEVDIARTGISKISDVAVGLNLNSAQLADIEMSEELIAMADLVLVGDTFQMSAKLIKDQFPQLAAFPDEMVLMMVQASGLEGVEVVEDRIQIPIAQLEDSTDLNSAAFALDAEGDAAAIAALQCTDEMIAEQQAALDAASE